MTIILLLVATLATIALWWLSHQRLMEKPWLETGPAEAFRGVTAGGMPAEKIALGVFLAVVSSLFALFASAYSMRMHMASDWRSLPLPWLLWPNTIVLFLSSLAMGWAQIAVRRGDAASLRKALLAGGASAFLFLVGQLMAWQQLAEGGFYLAANPANAFFYLLTALHGLHLLGGLVAWGRTIVRTGRSTAARWMTLSVDLCALYWHFMLLVWLAILALLLHG
ncbi:cytochrome c oxidase subunit 3 [Teichococcus oryzae]|uniref:Cytochrome-c oxidase n=1 Tax=Teichococcus oryzae TaxID=1608942 RepID=A0A5B2TC03_9PROT|nr:cytochrome c oxidase subunit 3 [Pseudoroseomonas oryzae]KAA2212037.1 cytochrome-c oxidase [Pseudoroseomonas oryzae]